VVDTFSPVVDPRFSYRGEDVVLTRQVGDNSLQLDEAETKKLLDAYAEELSMKRLEWQNIQVSLVAGAGFEPAAFRL
jgi:hypothetical protein